MSTTTTTSSSTSPSSPPTASISSSQRIIAWIALSIAVLSMSSGGIWFALLLDTPPAMKVTWRLFFTSLLQLPGFGYQFFKPSITSNEIRQRWYKEIFTMIITGIFLAIHFISWSWSISHTSLTHSLLFVSATPLLIVLWMTIKYYIVIKCIYRNTNIWNQINEDNHHSTNTASPTANDPMVEENIATGLDTYPTSTIPITLENDTKNTEDTEIIITTSNTNQQANSTSVSELHSSNTVTSSSATTTSSLSSFFRSKFHTYFLPENSLLPTKLEIIGAIIGFLSVVILLGDAEESTKNNNTDTSTYDAKVSVAGDAMALLGAAAMVIYLGVGGKLRKWMPLFLYAFPVTFSASIVSLLLSISFEPHTYIFLDNNDKFGPTTFFGWLGDGTRFGLTFGAALCSGIMGHTFANYSLSYINPLIVSVCILAEPLLGSLIGWVTGIQGIPSILTLIAGPLLLLGAFFTTIGARDSGFQLQNWKKWICFRRT